jgi:aspartate aminotransferase
MLTFGDTRHFDPVGLRPEIADYAIYVDGISKPFAATGLRVGWTAAPPDVARKMASIVGHMGAWAPRPEQVATAEFLCAPEEIEVYHKEMKQAVENRLEILFEGIEALQREGLPVEAIPPMGAIYLSARFAVNGARAPGGEPLVTNEEIRRYLLRKAGVAMVPFEAFGRAVDDGWFRMSVGAVSESECEALFPRLRTALQPLSAR